MVRVYPKQKPTAAGEEIVYEGRTFVSKMVNPKGKQPSYLRWYRADTNKGTYAGAKQSVRRVDCVSEKGRVRSGMKRVPALSPYCAEPGREYPGSENPPRMFVIKENGERRTWILAKGQRKARKSGGRRRSSASSSAASSPVPPAPPAPAYRARKKKTVRFSSTTESMPAGVVEIRKPAGAKVKDLPQVQALPIGTLLMVNSKNKTFKMHVATAKDGSKTAIMGWKK